MSKNYTKYNFSQIKRYIIHQLDKSYTQKPQILKLPSKIFIILK